MRLIDLTGTVFGRLTVVERAGSVGDKVRWCCLCVCGRTTKATSGNLKRGFVTSCGCYRREFIRGNQLPDGVSGFNGLFNRYRTRAKKNQIPFSLPKDVFKHLTEQDCFYCGKSPSQSVSSLESGKSRYIYNGVDRRDSGGGYEIENCVPCCRTCNYMKLDMSIKDFIAACMLVIKHQTGLGLETSPSNV